MDRRDIVVIGGSAGGLEALLDLLPRLSPDFPASVFVVIHVAARAVSILPSILDNAAQLPVVQARDRERFRPGHVYVAQPDFHLAIGGGETRVYTGPREHRSRPAIDPLFRSAARGYGPRVVGIVLSGANGDGTQGLSIVKRAGGIAAAQDPRTASQSRMPESAATQVEMDFVGAPADIASFLESAVREPLYPRPRVAKPRRETKEKSVFRCPECGGALQETDEPFLRFRCRVGHAHSPESLMEGQRDAVEGALWAGVNALEERAELARRMADRARHSAPNVAASFDESASDFDRQADTIRRVLVDAVRTRTPTEEATSEELTDDPLDLLEEEPLDDPSEDASPEPPGRGNGG